MGNPSKRKGDNGELHYVAHMQQTHPDLVRPDAGRILGAGRRDDRGDVRVLYGVATQVKAWGNVSGALLDAADGALRQKRNAGDVLGVGIVKVPHARGDRPRWLASTLEDEWPAPLPEHTPTFRLSGRLLSWLLTTTDDTRTVRARAEATTTTARGKLPPPPVADPSLRVARWVVRGQSLTVAPEAAWVRHASPVLQRARDFALGSPAMYEVLR